jgi:hypothetical protein
MRFLRLILSVVSVAALTALAFVPSAQADESNKETYVTFSGPVELPGVALPAGTYTFRLADSLSNRHIVQVFSRDGKHLYGTFLAIADSRMEPSDKTVITFAERAAHTPEALKEWFYPGDLIGQEFVYPKAKAITLARASGQPVLAMPSEMAPLTTKPTTSMSESHVVAMKHAPVTTMTPEGKEVPAPRASMQEAQAAKPAQPTGTSGTTATPHATAHPKRLPKTASHLPTLALIGGIALAGSLVLRRAAERAA